MATAPQVTTGDQLVGVDSLGPLPATAITNIANTNSSPDTEARAEPKPDADSEPIAEFGAGTEDSVDPPHTSARAVAETGNTQAKNASCRLT